MFTFTCTIKSYLFRLLEKVVATREAVTEESMYETFEITRDYKDILACSFDSCPATMTLAF